MHLELTNHKVLVREISDEEQTWLFDYLVIETTGFKRDHATGRAVYDGVKVERLYDLAEESFLSGFLPQVYRKAVQLGYVVTVSDSRVVPPGRDAGADLKWLRDYQLTAIDAACARKRGMLQLATGAGKGEIAAGLVRALSGVRWLVLVHRSGLMRDLAARLVLRAEEQGHPPPSLGFYGDGEHCLDGEVTYATFQTLSQNASNPKVRAYLRTVEAVLVDEAHTLAAGAFARVVEKLPNAYYRLGLSGTPLDRGDKRSSVAVGLLGPVIYKVPAQLLIERGVLAKPEVRMVRYDAEEIVSGIWHTVRAEGILQSSARNDAVVSAIVRTHKPALVFVDQLAHGRLLTERVQQLGINAEFVWGKHSTEQRAASVQRLERGEVDVVVCSSVFSEGVDIPSLASVVLAAGGKSVIAVLQRIGRGMRRTADKATFQIWDFEDRTHRILEDHMQARKRAYKREGHTVVADVGQLALPGATEPPKRVRYAR
jgi:superfamily II DNA or RNA helicase